MYVVYSAPDAATVHLLKGILDQRGIRTIVRGEFLQGGVAPTEGWVELFVLKMQDVPEAKAVVEEVVSAGPTQEGEPWTCPGCGESSEGRWRTWWNCGTEGGEWGERGRERGTA